jgi:hypothetical protein
VTLLPVAETHYGSAVTFHGSVDPAVADEHVSLVVAESEVATALTAADGTFEFQLAHVVTPGPYEAATQDATSAPVSLGLHPLVRATFLGAPVVGRRLALAAHVTPATAGTVAIRLYRDGTPVRRARGADAVRLDVPTDRVARYHAVVHVKPAAGWLGAEADRGARVTCTRKGAEPARAPDDGIVFRNGSFQPLLSLAALNTDVRAQRCGAVRRLAHALLSRAVRSGHAIYWEYDFPFHGSPVPWRSGFAQAVGAQALARAGVMLRDPDLTRAANASFRGLRWLLLPEAGGSWIREYGFTREVILNSQLQSLFSLHAYAHLVKTRAAARVLQSVYRATVRLLPSFDLGCQSLYELGGKAADQHYQGYHVALLKLLAGVYPDEPVFRRFYLRWQPCA